MKALYLCHERPSSGLLTDMYSLSHTHTCACSLSVSLSLSPSLDSTRKDRIQQLGVTRKLSPGNNATILGADKNTPSQDGATALPLIQENREGDIHERTASPSSTLIHEKTTQDGSQGHCWETQAKTIEQGE